MNRVTRRQAQHTQQINLRLSPEIKATLATLAKRWRLTESETIRTLIVNVAARQFKADQVLAEKLQ